MTYLTGMQNRASRSERPSSEVLVCSAYPGCGCGQWWDAGDYMPGYDPKFCDNGNPLNQWVPRPEGES